MTNSQKSQSEKPETNRGRETAAKTLRTSRAHTTHATRARVGGRDWGQSPGPTPGPCTRSSE